MRGFGRACSSAGEHYVDIVGVTGSIPVASTIFPQGIASVEETALARSKTPVCYTSSVWGDPVDQQRWKGSLSFDGLLQQQLVLQGAFGRRARLH